MLGGHSLSEPRLSASPLGSGSGSGSRLPLGVPAGGDSLLATKS